MDTRRVFHTGIFVFFVFLGLSASIGCGSSSNGDGTGPSPSPGQPQITSISPSTVVAGAASFTLTVNGRNFTPTTTVLWNNNGSLPATYISSTVLRVQVPAGLVREPETVTITPSPLGPFNFGANLTIAAPSLTGNNSFSVSMVPVQANDMVLDQANQQLYLSVASTNGTNANTITALNPQTGAFGSSVSTGSDRASEPGKLAVSSDGTYIYAGLPLNGSVRRYTLPALQSDIDISLGGSLHGQPDGYGQYYAIDVAVQPSNAHSIAVSRGVINLFPMERGGVVVYDDAIARSQSVPGTDYGTGPIDSLLWNPNGQTLYGINTESVSASALYIMPVSSAGVQLPMQGSFGYPSPLGKHLQFDSTTGYLYSDTGMVIDPAKGFGIGSFPLNALQGGLFNSIMVPDGKLNIAYFLGQTRESNGTGTYVIEAFDLTHFTLIGTISIPNVSGGPPSKMIRWGSNGLAFLTGTGVYLVSGGFVTSPAP